MKSFEYLTSESQTEALKVCNILNIPRDNIKAHTKKRVIILTNNPRKSIINKLKDHGYEYNSLISGSSLGGLVKNNIEYIIKPLSKQGIKSAGKENEFCFIDLINSHIKDKPINININGHTIEGVNKCIDASYLDSQKLFKADAQLLDVNDNILSNISLKKRNAIRWESCRRRTYQGHNIFSLIISKIMKNSFPKLSTKEILGKTNRFKMICPSSGNIISKVVLEGLPKYLLEETVFGNDNPKTIVIKEDFEVFNNYKFINNTLYITCFKLYTKIDDILGTFDEPVFALSHHINQNYGIEFRSFSKSVLYDDKGLRNNIRKIHWNDITKGIIE